MRVCYSQPAATHPLLYLAKPCCPTLTISPRSWTETPHPAGLRLAPFTLQQPIRRRFAAARLPTFVTPPSLLNRKPCPCSSALRASMPPVCPARRCTAVHGQRANVCGRKFVWRRSRANRHRWRTAAQPPGAQLCGRRASCRGVQKQQGCWAPPATVVWFSA